MNQSIIKVENETGKTEGDCAINSIDYLHIYVVSEQHNKIGIQQCFTSLMQLLLAKILH